MKDRSYTLRRGACRALFCFFNWVGDPRSRSASTWLGDPRSRSPSFAAIQRILVEVQDGLDHLVAAPVPRLLVAAERVLEHVDQALVAVGAALVLRDLL